MIPSIYGPLTRSQARRVAKMIGRRIGRGDPRFTAAIKAADTFADLTTFDLLCWGCDVDEVRQHAWCAEGARREALR